MDRDSFSQLLDEDVGCGWSTRFAMVAFGAFLISEIGAIWSHESTLDQLVYDMDRMRSCAKYLVKDSDSQESKNCGDARRQYKAFEKQVEAYESVKTGLNAKYVALWAMGGAMLLATILETKMWYFEEWKDNAIIATGTADAAACITAKSLRPMNVMRS